MRDDDYDAVVVLLLDRVHPARDTLSTHALMRGGVLQLHRWGVLPGIVAAGTPAVTGTSFHYGDRVETIPLAAPLYAPRRPVLDTALLDAALAAGVEARFGVDVTGLTSDRTGRVTGVRARVRGGGDEQIPARLTVGADGLRSGVARAVGARTSWQGTAASAFVYGYWPHRHPDPDPEPLHRPGRDQRGHLRRHRPARQGPGHAGVLPRSAPRDHRTRRRPRPALEVRVIDVLTLTAGRISAVTMVADELSQLRGLGALTPTPAAT